MASKVKYKDLRQFLKRKLEAVESIEPFALETMACLIERLVANFSITRY